MSSSPASPGPIFHNYSYSAAHMLSRTRKRAQITPIIEDLHWLPVSFRADFLQVAKNVLTTLCGDAVEGVDVQQCVCVCVCHPLSLSYLLLSSAHSSPACCGWNVTRTELPYAVAVVTTSSQTRPDESRSALSPRCHLDAPWQRRSRLSESRNPWTCCSILWSQIKDKSFANLKMKL